MNLSVGIVGLPNVGKSTLFNALLNKQIAQVGEYPYTTIEPNVGVVEVPDERLEKISEATKIEKTIPAAIKFIDIAGLIRGAHKGEGLGNQFLAKIREVDVIVHVVRAFENPNVSHPHGKIDPKEDIEIVNLEFEMADIKKPTIYVLNVSETDLKSSLMIQIIELIKVNYGAQALLISAKLEAELSDLSSDEQKQYLDELGIKESSLDKVIREGYKLLDLIAFFTVAAGKSASAEASARPRQVQAWPIKKGLTAIEAAEIVHSDFAKGFIAAEIVGWQDLVDSGSWHNAKEKGLIKTAGRDEIIEDGQVVEFKFSI